MKKLETKKIFIITGEHSGDLHASCAVKALKKTMPDIIIEAVGGENLQNQGVKLFRDHSNSEMGVVGISPQAIINHIQLGLDIINYLKNEFKPDLVLLVDYGGFNLRMARELKKHGIETFYYISPQVWASRRGRINMIKKYVSKLMVIFPFEENLHRSKGVNVEYVGHPLISQLDREFSKEEFVKMNGLNPHKKIIGIFPGSRKMELKYMMSVFLGAAQIIYGHSKKVQFCIGQAPNISDELFQKYFNRYKDSDLDIKVLKNQNHALLACSDVVLLASGTITLEAAIYKTPMVVSYKAPRLIYWLYLLLRYLSFVSLPNIIAGKEIVKEYIQNEAKPELIAVETLSLLHNSVKREIMIEDLGQINKQLGDKIASDEVAKIIKKYFDIHD